ncbi:MAG TPA: hypothetical protein VK876_10370, partial [Rubrivivax sp.]|nr:hypothetical protein [Rubrivivax sp.]
MPDASQDSEAPARSRALRWFGRLQLLRLLGKSERSMAWRVAEPRGGQEWMLVLPRQPPPDAQALEQWQQATRQAARLNHPQLAAVVETGVQDGWPFVAYELQDCATLAERVAGQGLPGAEAAALAVQVLRGLAYAHEAGVAHHDPQPYLVLLGDNGQLRLAGLAVAAGAAPGWGGAAPGGAVPGRPALAPCGRRARRSGRRRAAARHAGRRQRAG